MWSFAEINFSRVGMDDFDVAKEDTEGRIQLDPSVWGPLDPKPAQTNHFSLYQSPDFLRHHMPQPQYGMPAPIQQPMMQQQNQQHHQMNSLLESLQSGMVSVSYFNLNLLNRLMISLT